MIKGVIFDADGTLLNSMPVWEHLGELYLKSLGIEAEKGLSEVLFTMSMQQGAEYIIEQYHLEMNPQQVMDGVNRELADFYKKKVPLKEGVRDFLEGIREKQLPIMIATTGDRSNLETALTRLNIRTYFSGILTCTELGTDKNHPDIYLASALQMDIEPKETLVFEDAYHAVRTAKKAGFPTVAVYDKANDRELGKIWNTADMYLPAYENFELFWRRASNL